MESCLLVLCGLPASGKTTLARSLKEHLEHCGDYKVEHICFDDVLRLALRTSSSAGFEPALWRTARDQAELEVHRLLRGAGSRAGRQVIIVDDNMQYRSMRYKYFKYARQYNCGFVIVHLEVSLEDSLQRNCLRSTSQEYEDPISRALLVPEHVITKMATSLEEPQPKRFWWEMGAVFLPQNPAHNNEALNNVDDIKLIMGAIETGFSSPAPALPSAEDLEEQERLREASVNNLHHRLDLHLRALVSRAVTCVGKPGSGNCGRGSRGTNTHESTSGHHDRTADDKTAVAGESLERLVASFGDRVRMKGLSQRDVAQASNEVRKELLLTVKTAATSAGGERGPQPPLHPVKTAMGDDEKASTPRALDGRNELLPDLLEYIIDSSVSCEADQQQPRGENAALDDFTLQVTGMFFTELQHKILNDE